MNYKSLTLLLVITFSLSVFSQDSKKAVDFAVKGQPIVKVFANYNSNLGGTDQTEDFESMSISRAYLGYKASIAKNYSVKLIMDVGNTEGKYTTYLKTAALDYKNEKFSYSLGLISTKQFKVQEKFWGYRYLYKSFQDQYKYNSSADLGLAVAYQVREGLSVDAIVQNGEGYKHTDPTGTYRGGLGLTANIYKPLTFRIYYDISAKPEINRQNLVAFLGYKFEKKFRIGAEYNYQMNNQFSEEHNMFGYSAYASYIINKKFEVFARYDDSQSNVIEDPTARLDPLAWNINTDENVAILGVQYKPTKLVKVSANYRRAQSALEDFDAVNWLFINFELKL